MHHRIGGERGLMAAGFALIESSLWQFVIMVMSAKGTDEPVWPFEFEEVFPASGFGSEPPYELGQRHLPVWFPHDGLLH